MPKTPAPRSYKPAPRVKASDGQFIIHNGLRKILPYEHTFRAYCKQRWIGQTIYNLCTTEFRDRTQEFYKEAIQQGLITINEKIVALNYVMKGSDLLAHKVHRHEPPVTTTPIQILYEDENKLVINKPSSLPVHPTGRYRFNTVLEILKKEHGYKDVITFNRLDRLTSGVLIVPRNPLTAKEFGQWMEADLIKKTYLARVMGDFPFDTITVDQPIKTFNHKLGLNIVHPDGKHAITKIRKLSTNGRTSMVECTPITGRTHQIRVHLQYLGHPIVNDPLYCNDQWGKDGGKGGVSASELPSIVERFDDATLTHDQLPAVQLKNTDDVTSCPDCTNPYPDPLPGDLIMWLHAVTYEGPGWSYSTETPDWAKEEYDCSEVVEGRKVWKGGAKRSAAKVDMLS